MRISYKNSRFDLFIFSTAHQMLSPVMQAFFVVISVLFGLSATNHRYVVVIALCVIAYVALWLVQILANAIIIALRNNRTVLTEHSVELLDDGLLEETSFNKSLYHWSGITGVAARPGHLAIYVAPGIAHLVPNRAFSSRAARLNFMKQIQERVAAAAA
jgi:YcxB-like protein